MKFLTFFVLFLLCGTAASSQVHVRGYYRSNGTYVAPHERTRPNSTVTDNYSYPGNYNPNKGNRASDDVNLSSYTPPAYYLESEGSKINTNNKKSIFVNTQTARLRTSPSVNSEVICNLSFRQPLLLVEDAGYGWSKILYKYYKGHDLSLPRYVVGFVNTGLLSPNFPTKKEYVYVDGRKFEIPIDATMYLNSDLNENLEAVSSYLKRNYESRNNPITSSSNFTSGNCLYTTSFANPTISPPLRSGPDVDSPLVYTCPKNSVICVLERNSGIYYKIKVDGQVGYVSKGFLISK